MPVPDKSSHQSPVGQSVSSLQALPQAPLVVSQNAPPWLVPEQLALVVHVPHAPVVVQYGAVVPGHAAVAVVPSSPLHATHVFDVASHTGEAPEHVLLVLHATHRPLFAPAVAQMPDRHTVVAVPVVHAPSPFA